MRSARGDIAAASPLSSSSNSNSVRPMLPYTNESRRIQDKQELRIGPAFDGELAAWITAENEVRPVVCRPFGCRRMLSAARSVNFSKAIKVSNMSTELLIHSVIFNPGPTSAVMVIEEFEPSRDREYVPANR